MMKNNNNNTWCEEYSSSQLKSIVWRKVNFSMNFWPKIIMQGFIALFKKFATFITYYPFIMNFNKYLTEMKKDYL